MKCLVICLFVVTAMTIGIGWFLSGHFYEDNDDEDK